MAEKIKDNEDRLLEALFESPQLADDGFSTRVVRRVNRQLWLRRLTMPVAVAIGGLIAFKPLAGIVTVIANFWTLVPDDLVSNATGAIPQFQTVALGAVLLVVGLISARLLEH